jgi:hypothetical protein
MYLGDDVKVYHNGELANIRNLRNGDHVTVFFGSNQYDCEVQSFRRPFHGILYVKSPGELEGDEVLLILSGPYKIKKLPEILSFCNKHYAGMCFK